MLQTFVIASPGIYRRQARECGIAGEKVAWPSLQLRTIGKGGSGLADLVLEFIRAFLSSRNRQVNVYDRP